VGVMSQDIRHQPLFSCVRVAAGLGVAIVFIAFSGAQVLAEQSADAAQAAPNLQQISKTPESWPETISVVEPVSVDLSMDGRKVGHAKFLPAQKLKVVGIEDGKVLVAVGSIMASLAPEQTNFWQNYDARQQELAAVKPISVADTATEPPAALPSQPPPTPEAAAALPRIGASVQTVQLTRRQAEKNGGGGLPIVAGRYYQPLPSSPSSLKSEPECAAPAYFEISIAGQQVPLVVDFADPNRVKVFFDPKGAGDLRTAPPSSAQNSTTSRGGPPGYGQYEIGPLAMESGVVGGRGTPFKLLVTRYPSEGSSGNRQGYVRVVPVEHFSGSATLAGRKVDIVLVDSDFDGKLAPGFRTEFVQQRSSGPLPPYDCIAVDWNGDRQFDYRSEIFPLVSLLGFGGKHYELTPAENASSLGIREVQLEMGAFEKSSSDFGLVLVSEKAVVLLDSRETGQWKVPAGEYAASYFCLSSKKGGVDWILHGNEPGPGLQKIGILPGQTTALKVGAPLTPKFEVSWRGDTAYIGFSMAGVGGETYEPGGRMGGKRQQPPDFKVFNRDGKILERGTFEYG
jgi:hypothetical protein